MNRHTFPLTDDHQQIQLLLPWYVNHSLEQYERKQVASHLRSCILCSRELVVLRKLSAEINQASVLDVAADASFAGLRAKLLAVEPVRSSINQQNLSRLGKPASLMSGLSDNTASRVRRLLRFRGGPGKYFAIAVLMLLVMIPLIMQFESSPVIMDYYTLSSAKPASPKGAKLRIVFSKSLPDIVIDSLLEKVRGKIVEGPNSVGAYTVSLGDGQDSSQLTTSIAFLRNQKNVLLVEPVIEP
ncbi:hypothetical protein [Methylobacter psychrophilus]|uniref:hypothetical protein n=1 Tax=Methylobacter psychrophilus TaxID=96941 RepID=UPI0021D4E6CC|nr:hypothetical protein [Methylobacter psychrophilus]